MKLLLALIFVLGLVLNNVHSKHIKTIEKRQICSNNGCNACDGRSCNTCNNDVCCSTVNCNKCVNHCSNECNTVSCKNNCVSGCTNSCQQQTCTEQPCTQQCVNKCSNDCSTRQCTNDCSKKCNDCTDKDSHEVLIVPSGEPSQVIVNNTNNNVVNLTTHININNVVHNLNNISIPVYVNTTNINNINLSETHSETSGNGTGVAVKEIPIPYPIPYPISNPTNNNCCYMLHPRQCYTDDEGQDRCYVRRSRECSDACTSPVVSVERDVGSTGCQRVGSWPYVYCGNYARRDCNQCYTCGGNYNPRECFRQNECSDSCRRNAPNCVPSEFGLQCY